MKVGSEDRKKLILASSLGVLALGTILYELVGSGNDSSPSTPVPAPVVRTTTPNPIATHVAQSALDPTLHPEGMLATEALVYSGSGRNIFSAYSEPMAKVDIPKPIAPVRTASYTPPSNSGPPPPPPIELRFFGTAQRKGGKRQAFFLQGEDVFLASEGDIVARRYKVGAINATSAQVTDLTNNNTQTLPMVLQ